MDMSVEYVDIYSPRVEKPTFQTYETILKLDTSVGTGDSKYILLDLKTFACAFDMTNTYKHF